MKQPSIPCEICDRRSGHFFISDEQGEEACSQICPRCYEAKDVEGHELRRLFGFPKWKRVSYEEYVVRQVMQS